jgi:hypothetical protein
MVCLPRKPISEHRTFKWRLAELVEEPKSVQARKSVNILSKQGTGDETQRRIDDASRSEHACEK